MKRLFLVPFFVPFFAGMLTIPAAQAAVNSASKDVIVMQPSDLPESAQVAGQSMRLRSVGNGSSYLYVEQQQLGRLAILDVTDPGRIRAVGFVKFDQSAPYDFVSDLGASAVLVCFRDNKGAAVIDFSKPKEPEIAVTDGLRQAANTQSIGNKAILMVNEPRSNADTTARDYQVVDTSVPLKPTLLITVHRVQETITDPETGATYLLGSDGLTVVRRPEVEGQERANASTN